jgi:phage shock protein PspC (stress-responsive transcriptional regulator)
MASAPPSAAQPPAAPRSDVHDAPQRPAAGRPAQAQLARYPDRGLLGGVGSGFALYLGLDVRAVRIMMAAMLVAGGVGVLLYALAWALIPVASESEGVARPKGGSSPVRCSGCVALAC